MTAGTDTFTFAFLANSDLLSAIQYPSSISAARSYEPNRDLITGVEHKHDTTVVSNYFYENDVIGRRRFMEKSGTAFAFHPQTDRITYEYNDRSEVVGAESSLAATYDYGFSFDPIGNRLTSTSKETGTPVTRNYTSNNLNQYTAVDNPSVAPSYDDDGNMTALPISSGTWDCSWNAENRLIVMEKAEKRLEFAYDYMGRRVEKKTFTGSSGNWTLATHLRFVYDGYLQIEELDGMDSNALLKKRYWTGVEGYDRLISETHVSTGNTYYVMTDANKNLTEYLTNAGALAGHYGYSPFGQITQVSGALSDQFDFRFSSEFFEQETGLVYYNYRYYSPEIGRWLGREPLGDISHSLSIDNSLDRKSVSAFEGDYTFTINNAYYYYDYLGHEAIAFTALAPALEQIIIWGGGAALAEPTPIGEIIIAPIIIGGALYLAADYLWKRRPEKCPLTAEIPYDLIDPCGNKLGQFRTCIYTCKHHLPRVTQKWSPGCMAETYCDPTFYVGWFQP
jgi:RHS repeat-associated protein